jgi:hypothetical protein
VVHSMSAARWTSFSVSFFERSPSRVGCRKRVCSRMTVTAATHEDRGRSAIVDVELSSLLIRSPSLV